MTVPRAGRHACRLAGQGFGVISALAAMRLNNAAAAGQRVPHQISGAGELDVTRPSQVFALAVHDFSSTPQGALLFVCALEPQ